MLEEILSPGFVAALVGIQCIVTCYILKILADQQGRMDRFIMGEKVRHDIIGEAITKNEDGLKVLAEGFNAHAKEFYMIRDHEAQIHLINNYLRGVRQESMARAIQDATENPEKYLTGRFAVTTEPLKDVTPNVEFALGDNT